MGRLSGEAWNSSKTDVENVSTRSCLSSICNVTRFHCPILFTALIMTSTISVAAPRVKSTRHLFQIKVSAVATLTPQCWRWVAYCRIAGWREEKDAGRQGERRSPSPTKSGLAFVMLPAVWSFDEWGPIFCLTVKGLVTNGFGGPILDLLTNRARVREKGWNKPGGVHKWWSETLRLQFRYANDR